VVVCEPREIYHADLHRISGKRRFNIKLWKTFTDCFNCLPIAAIIDEKIFTMHGGLSPDLQSMEQIRRVMRPTDVPDTGASDHGLEIRQLLTYSLLQVCCATCYGQIQTRTSLGGQKTIEECHLRLVQTWSQDSFRSMIWI
jgi:hypothetical protein